MQRAHLQPGRGQRARGARQIDGTQDTLFRRRQEHDLDEFYTLDGMLNVFCVDAQAKKGGMHSHKHDAA